MIIGIDVGKNGAIVLLSDKKEVVDTLVTPTRNNEIDLEMFISELRYWLSLIGRTNIVAYIEDVHAIYGCSAGSTFNFGQAFMMAKAVVASLDIPYVLVQPKKWQAEMFEGIDEIRKPSTRKNKKGEGIKGGRDTKAMALMAATKLFPDVDLTATARSTKPHDGIVDALLIAEYGRRKELG